MDIPELSWTGLSERLGEVAGLLLTAEEPDEVLRQISALATRTIPVVASCSVTVHGPDGPATAAAANDLANQLDELQYANGDGPCLDALYSGTPVPVCDMSSEDRWGQYPDLAVGHGVLSTLSLPLAPAGKTLGALNLYATVAHGFDDEPMRALADLFAGQAGVILAGAQRHGEQLRLATGLRAQVEALLAAERDRSWRAERRREGLEGFIEQLSGSLDAQQVADAAVEAAARSTGASAAALFQRVTDGGSEWLELLAERNFSDAARARLTRLPVAEAGPLGQALSATNGPLVVAADETAEHPLLAELLTDCAVVAVPLPGRIRALGVLALTHPDGSEPDAEELGHVLTVARLAAAGMERARLATVEAAAAAEQVQAARSSAILARASAELVSSVARNQALPTLLHHLVPDLADWAAAHVLEEDGSLRLVDVRHGDPGRDDVREALTLLNPSTADETGLGAVAREGRSTYYPVLAGQVVAGPGADPAAAERLTAIGATAVLAVPLLIGGRALGTVMLARNTGGYSPAEVELVEQISGRAAVSLDNSQLYHRERTAALTLQRSLLPAGLPSVLGLEVAARYLPGTAGTEAGGDFYDVIPLDGGRTGLALGDVMGRGIPAAATMGQLRAALRAYALENHPPAALLTRLHRVVSTLGAGAMTTCTYAVYDPWTAELFIATAGHLPPILSGPGQVTRYLDLAPGLPLGIDGATFTETVLTLPEETTLLLCTDGLVESREQPLQEGMDRLWAAVDEVRLPPELVCEHVLSRLRPNPDRPADDDIALLVAATREVNEPPGR